MRNELPPLTSSQPTTLSKTNMRYTIETGKFGQYVRDNNEARDLPLDEVANFLNDGHYLQGDSVEERGEVSDGFHTFNELYDHRCTLFLALMASHNGAAWISKKHADGTEWDGWFIAGMALPWGGEDVTYHLPESMWELAKKTNAKVLETGLPWDGHTSGDVVQRIQEWIIS